jgi:hypothetical protein
MGMAKNCDDAAYSPVGIGTKTENFAKFGQLYLQKVMFLEQSRLHTHHGSSSPPHVTLKFCLGILLECTSINTQMARPIMVTGSGQLIAR